MLIAVPSYAPGGLDSTISEHFGHCGAFTIVSIANGEIGEVSILENSGHEQGGCMAPVQLLKQAGVDVLVAGGMGQHPLSGFQQVGIAVHFKEDAVSVHDAIEKFLKGDCPAFGAAQTCGGGGGGCGGHHHEEVMREPIEGVADIRDGRIVTLDFEITDGDGAVLDTSKGAGPMRYLHGAGQLLPALEEAVIGLELGEQKSVEIPCKEAFGERDETRILEVPRTQLPPDATIGMMVSAHDPSGRQIPLIVVHLDDTTARLDANHPFAGKDVIFNVTVTQVENATEDEIAHGHMH